MPYSSTSFSIYARTDSIIGRQDDASVPYHLQTTQRNCGPVTLARHLCSASLTHCASATFKLNYPHNIISQNKARNRWKATAKKNAEKNRKTEFLILRKQPKSSSLALIWREHNLGGKKFQHSRTAKQEVLWIWEFAAERMSHFLILTLNSVCPFPLKPLVIETFTISSIAALQSSLKQKIIAEKSKVEISCFDTKLLIRLFCCSPDTVLTAASPPF